MNPLLEDMIDMLRAKAKEGTTFYAYENAELNPSNGQQVVFLLVGPGCTYTQPPPHAPDSQAYGTGWKMLLKGRVDLEKGEIIPVDPPDPRYPYTYADDLIRSLPTPVNGSVSLSRSDAAQIREGLAKALDMHEHLMAMRLADYYKANEEAISKRTTDALVSQIVASRGGVPYAGD